MSVIMWKQFRNIINSQMHGTRDGTRSSHLTDLPGPNRQPTSPRRRASVFRVSATSIPSSSRTSPPQDLHPPPKTTVPATAETHSTRTTMPPGRDRGVSGLSMGVRIPVMLLTEGEQKEEKEEEMGVLVGVVVVLGGRTTTWRHWSEGRICSRWQSWPRNRSAWWIHKRPWTVSSVEVPDALAMAQKKISRWISTTSVRDLCKRFRRSGRTKVPRSNLILVQRTKTRRVSPTPPLSKSMEHSQWKFEENCKFY